MTNWNAHQAILDNTNLWLVSKTDGQLFKIKLELTKRELAEEKAKMEQYKCRLLDEGVIEAIKRAKEQFNNSKN